MADAAELIRGAKRPERIVPICMRGDLVAEHEQLDARLVAVRRQPSRSLAGNPEEQQLVQRIRDLEAEMAKHVVGFRVRALPRRQWAGLVAAHPPRRDDTGRIVDSDVNGVNVDSFVEQVLRKCIVEPELDDELWDTLLDESLTDGGWEQLTDAMWSLNRREVNVPFSHAASRIPLASAPE